MSALLRHIARFLEGKKIIYIEKDTSFSAGRWKIYVLDKENPR